MALPLASGTWNIDKSHSAVEFSVRHLGLTNVRGRFDTFDGAITIGETLADTKVNAVIQLSSINTNSPDRDTHLKSTDFFGVDTHVDMVFASTGIEGSGDEYKLHGDLTLRGITKAITLDVEFGGVEASPFDKKPRAGFSAEGTLSRKDYGIDFNVPLGGDKLMVGDKIKINLELELLPPA